MLSIYIKKVKRIKVIIHFLIRIIGVDLSLIQFDCSRETYNIRTALEVIKTIRL